MAAALSIEVALSARFHARCIFHIKHSQKLEQLYWEGGAGVIEEKGNWKGGRDFLLAVSDVN